MITNISNNKVLKITNISNSKVLKIIKMESEANKHNKSLYLGEISLAIIRLIKPLK